ncbi:MAG: oligopeptide transporter ATP-binding protein [Naasia sp.]|jgi:oligopeptide/dipeptide ABC transporter ATP-binding protein|uniref:oligopeptide/dipeptide ABC transporter ATP-binding protein n=1 Tax=Naasia sp. TaxID=2546198 RepID=UPI00262F1D2C|nr:oligopeptide/dipeptide ABC transporter ATP-binding protein [Naasia sp.]MCU1571906.1 oligopeptide transporter ATP-binding protein [Naasia sp.]
MTATAVFEVRDLVKVFRARGSFRRGVTRPALDGVSFEVRQGEALGIVGESGSGKTTLGRILIGLDRPTSGEVLYEGEPTRRMGRRARQAFRQRVQMVFQNPFASLNPFRTVRSALADGFAHRPLSRFGREAAMVSLMEQVGLNETMLDRYPHEFSGGQRQRVVLARALTVEPGVIVADEPVSALDVSIQAQVLNLLNDLKSRLGLTLVFVTHDLRVVNFFCDRIAVMYMGRLVELGTRAQIMESSRHPYTRMLLSAAPRDEPGVRIDRPWVRNEVDATAPRADACNFAARCWARQALGNPERCTTERPDDRPAQDGRMVACHFGDEIPALAGAETAR